MDDLCAKELHGSRDIAGILLEKIKALKMNIIPPWVAQEALGRRMSLKIELREDATVRLV
jgi:hypothetical protein